MEWPHTRRRPLRTAVPYSGYLKINFTATEQTGWLLSYSSINSTFWDATYYDTNLIYDLWIGAPAAMLMDGTFRFPVYPGAVYILIENFENGASTVTYSVTYHY